MGLSVVVISYNMRRELPRTIATFAPTYQQDLRADDYEVIVVDNGSTDGQDLERLHELAPNLRVARMADPTPSPVLAINHGLSLAGGELIGVCIDGARMASPRLLASAVEASRVHARPVVGSLAFHLGPDVQSQSMLTGYDQAAEDDLLASVDWRQDGYRLFDVSVPAASSRFGWFQVPAETNALFLTRDHWRELGGYDPAFRTPGGGFANLDVWERLCADPTACVVLLLGEATFHQFHGGIATNSRDSRRQEFREEYLAIRGHHYQRPTRRPLMVGRMTHGIGPTLRRSVEQWEERS